MAFWSDPSSLLPKQSHRWVAFFGNTEDPNSLPQYFFKSIEKPSYEIGSVQAKYLYSHTFNFPKRVTWKPIKVEFYDIAINSDMETISMVGTTVDDVNKTKNVVKSTQTFFYSLLSKAGYFSPHEGPNREVLTFKNYTFKQNLSLAMLGVNTNNLKDPYAPIEHYIRIQELDENGVTLETWELYNPFITNVNFNKLDYSSDNILTITADIVYDWAELIPREIKTKKVPTTQKQENKNEKQNQRDILSGVAGESKSGVTGKQTDYTAGLPLDLSQPVTDGKSVVPRVTEVTYGNTDYYFAAGSDQLAITKK